MTAVSEGKSHDAPSRKSTGGKGAERKRDEGERGEASLPLVDPTNTRRTVPDFRTRRNERRTCGDEGRMPQMEKKRAGLYFPLTSERKRRSWSTRSSTNCLRGTGLGINLLLAPRLPFSFSLSSFSLFSRLSSSLFQTLPDVTRHSDEVIVQRHEKTWSNLDSQ